MTTDISQSETFGLPVNQDIAFTTHKGKFKERQKKQQLRTLEAYAPLLKQFLEPGEEILLAMRGCSPMSFLEQITTGWIIYLLKRCTLVVTNRRILHFPSKTNFAPKDSIAQIRYGDVEDIKAHVFLGRKFTVKYKSGAAETFLYVRQSAKLKSILQTLPMKVHQPTLIRGRHHLCPRCNAPLAPGVYTCAKCSLEFKNEKKAKWLSLLLPGGGYFYAGHPFLGIGDAVGETVLIIIVIFSVKSILFGTADPLNNLMLLGIFGAALVIEKVFTIYHARHYVREYVPLEKDFQAQKKD